MSKEKRDKIMRCVYIPEEEGVAIAIFRFLATTLAIAIVLPGALKHNDNSFVLSFTVFVFARLVDTIKGMCLHRGFAFAVHSLECVLDVCALGLFFFKMSLIMTGQTMVEIESVCSYVVLAASSMYVFSDLLFCMLVILSVHRERIMAANFALKNN